MPAAPAIGNSFFLKAGFVALKPGRIAFKMGLTVAITRERACVSPHTARPGQRLGPPPSNLVLLHGLCTSIYPTCACLFILPNRPA